MINCLPNLFRISYYQLYLTLSVLLKPAFSRLDPRSAGFEPRVAYASGGDFVCGANAPTPLQCPTLPPRGDAQLKGLRAGREQRGEAGEHSFAVVGAAVL